MNMTVTVESNNDYKTYKRCFWTLEASDGASSELISLQLHMPYMHIWAWTQHALIRAAHGFMMLMEHKHHQSLWKRWMFSFQGLQSQTISVRKKPAFPHSACWDHWTNTSDVMMMWWWCPHRQLTSWSILKVHTGSGLFIYKQSVFRRSEAHFHKHWSSAAVNKWWIQISASHLNTTV